MADANFSFSIPFTCLGISNFAEYVYIYIYIFFFFKQNAVFFLSDLATRASYNMLPERLTYHGLRKQPTFRDAIRLVSRRNDIQATSAETPYCWNVTIKIWVVLLIGWKSLYPMRRTTQLLVVTCHRYEIFCALCSKIISRGNQWWRGEMSAVLWGLLSHRNEKKGQFCQVPRLKTVWDTG